MKSLLRFSLAAAAALALAFFCEGLLTDLCSGLGDGVRTRTARQDSLTDPTRSEDSFIKFNTACLTSPLAEGQTNIRTTSGASGSACRHQQRWTVTELRTLTYKVLSGQVTVLRTLPSLRKLRL